MLLLKCSLQHFSANFSFFACNSKFDSEFKVASDSVAKVLFLRKSLNAGEVVSICLAGSQLGSQESPFSSEPDHCTKYFLTPLNNILCIWYSFQIKVENFSMHFLTF